MADIARQVYVVSDIHIGGDYPPDDDPEDRGFRISTHIPCFTEFLRAMAARPVGTTGTELVINGDFLDFLAEKDGEGNNWEPFTADPDRAVQKLEDIIARDQPVFDALASFVQQGHRLTILLGNHDIELALPKVRQRFKELLGVGDSHPFSFIYDGEAYVIGDVLIEHGNRYDKFNVVNHDLLRRVRSLQSRQQDVPPEHAFVSPPGSNIVASVMNPIKVDYPFIDLLKPETEAAIPVLLALEPGVRSKMGKIASIALQAQKHKMVAPAMPGFGGDINASDTAQDFGGDISASDDWISPSLEAAPSASPDPLREVLHQCLGEEADEFLSGLDSSTLPAALSIGEDISAGDTIERGWGLMRLMLSNSDSDVERRLPSLLAALRILRQDESFNRSIETSSEYLDAARELAAGGFRCVVFGHTHLPKYVPLDNNACYINTGTWADFMKFPEEILTGSKEQAIPKLREFLTDMKERRLSKWVGFDPTYARLDIDAEENLLQAELCDYTATSTL
jgi:UDP-2,3-diacylglucosamine pyrophosphatase LpxH